MPSHPSAGPSAPMAAMPEPVLAISAGRPVQAVWRNESGGITYFLPAAQQYIKWSPPGGIDLAVEADRLLWAAALGNTTLVAPAVPRLLSHGLDENGSWLVTAAVPGRSGVDGYWLARPAVAAAAIGNGLRRWHDGVPVGGCPYRWSTTDRLADVQRRRNQLDPLRWHPEHRRLTVDQAIHRLEVPPPVDRLVVCHGDACSPNTMIDDSGRAVALVDLGSVGVGDRWADLAIATWSVGWNYGREWEHIVLDAYGIEHDLERTAYYRLLWDLGP